MDRWAFGVSPHGLALDEWRFWTMAPCEVRALRKVWLMRHEVTRDVLAAIRADIHNSSEMLQRQDKRRWTPQDFGAGGEAAKEKVMRGPTPVELRIEAIKRFGPPNGADGKKKSALKTLKGQILPKKRA